jgi:hypothetical protein
MTAYDKHGPARPGIRPLTCGVCGSVWFRSATFLASDFPHSRLQVPLAVCLCGTLVTPPLSGSHPPADQDDIERRLFKALAIVRNWRDTLADTGVLVEVAVGATATLTTELARLERAGQLLRRRLLPSEAAVTRSRPPHRRAATNGLDKIALELQRAGLLNFRQARRVVWAVRDRWRAALVKGESVETPLGTLSTRKTPSGRSRFILNLRASSDLHAEVEVHHPERVRNMIPTQNTASSAQCPRCGSLWFAQHEFRQYADQMYSSTVGGSLSPLSSDPQYAPVCLCGLLFQPTRSPRARRLTPEQQSFLASCEKAQNYHLLQREAEEQTKKRVAAVDPEYIEQLSARVEATERITADLSVEISGRHLKPRRKPRGQEKP